MDTETEDSIVDDLFNLTQSDSASFTEYVTDRSHIAHPLDKDSEDTDNASTGNESSGSDENGNELYGSQVKSSNANSGVYLLQTPQTHQKNKKHNRRAGVKKSTVFHKDLKKNNLKKKVQVAKQETGTQRVQVNAGYENPDIPCLAQGCSGILLKWVLTFYGTLE